MSKHEELTALVVALEQARDLATAAGLDLHFVSDIDHLIVTARHNADEARKEATP